jgi:hypothetical protein
MRCGIVFFLSSIIFGSVGNAGDRCIDWFKNGKIEQNTTNCETRCSILPVDMGTFDCPARCDQFCKATEPKHATTYLPGVTRGDRKMIAKYPADSIKVYEAKERVEKLTKKLFGKEGKNDESDAFRHFVWAALLTKELGREKAEEFLRAHEDEPLQPAKEKEMDDANNKIGVTFANGKKDLELDEIEKAALFNLKENKLTVISPSGKIPDGYYSK